MRPIMLILLGALVFGSACSRQPAATVADDDRQMLRRTIQHDGIEREYFVHVPATTASENDMPVVIAIHGYGSTATGFAHYYALNRHADDNGYIIAYPQGSHFQAPGEAGTVTSWNDLAANQPSTPAGPHCSAGSVRYPRPPECKEFGECAWTSCYDDVGFIGNVVDDLQATFETDVNRYYLLGVSNGAMMALRLGCDMSERFAAVVPIIGQLAPGHACGPDTPLPMMHLVGGADDTVRYDGTTGSDGFRYTSARDTAALWAEALHCQSEPAEWQNRFTAAAGVECSAYADCGTMGQAVVSCMDADETHEWPGYVRRGLSPTCVTTEQSGSMPNQAICGADNSNVAHPGMNLAWSFLSKHQKRGE